MEITPSLPALWPPNYFLRISKRAKYVRLAIKVGAGLEIIVPYRFNKNRIPQLLNRHRDWIQEHIHKLTARPIAWSLPEQIALLAVGTQWQLEYTATASNIVKIEQQTDNGLLVHGNIQNKTACKQALNLWLREQAATILLPKLLELSKQHQLPFTRSRIGQQKTRWGSCNKQKHISLNANLLFLPPGLMKHVLLHELCHTIHLNHSVSFWTLLAQHDPACLEHKKALHKANTYLPDWIRIEPC
jgi:predicted metal-dependent hydrolase